MNRRKFIRASALIGGSTVTILGTASTSCSKKAVANSRTVGEKPKNYQIGTASASTKVMPESTFTNNNSAAIEIAGNEIGCFQVVIRPETTYEEVTVTVSDLENGTNRITGLTWHQVGYVYIGSFAGHPVPAEVAGKLPGWYPDPLLERDKAYLMKDWANCIWVSAKVPAGAPAGTYRGSVTFEIGSHTEVVEIEATVYGFAIPAVPTLPTLFSLAIDHLAKVYKPWSGEVRNNWLDFLAERRIAPTDLYVDLQGNDAQYRITPDEYRRYADQTNGFVIYPITVTWQDRDASAEELIRRFEANRAYIDAIIATGATAGGKGVFYGFDENDTTHFETMKEVHSHIKSAYPEIPIATTSMHITTLEQVEALQIDVLVLHITDGIYNNTFADLLRAAGKKVWGYISLQPYSPMPNWRIENELIEARVLLSAMAYHERFDGFLYWGVNQYNKGNWETPKLIGQNVSPRLDISITTPSDEYKWLHGDGLLIYPGTSGPLSSIRMENIYMGLAEYEYYKLVEAKFGRGEATRLAGQLAPNMETYNRDVKAYSDHKYKLAKKLED